jgi:hypothetical protein
MLYSIFILNERNNILLLIYKFPVTLWLALNHHHAGFYSYCYFILSKIHFEVSEGNSEQFYSEVSTSEPIIWS